MQSATDGLIDRPRIGIADEDPSVVDFVMQTLRRDGNAVPRSYHAGTRTPEALVAKLQALSPEDAGAAVRAPE